MLAGITEPVRLRLLRAVESDQILGIWHAVELLSIDHVAVRVRLVALGLKTLRALLSALTSHIVPHDDVVSVVSMSSTGSFASAYANLVRRAECPYPHFERRAVLGAASPWQMEPPSPREVATCTPATCGACGRHVARPRALCDGKTCQELPFGKQSRSRRAASPTVVRLQLKNDRECNHQHAHTRGAIPAAH